MTMPKIHIERLLMTNEIHVARNEGDDIAVATIVVIVVIVVVVVIGVLLLKIGHKRIARMMSSVAPTPVPWKIYHHFGDSLSFSCVTSVRCTVRVRAACKFIFHRRNDRNTRRTHTLTHSLTRSHATMIHCLLFETRAN